MYYDVRETFIVDRTAEDVCYNIVLCEDGKVWTGNMISGRTLAEGRCMTLVRWIMTIMMFYLAIASAADAEEIGCVSTTWRVWADDKICVSAFDDPKVPGVACHLSHARTGGFKGTVGVAEDRSRFSIACRQVGPITVDLTTLPKEEEAFSERTSLFFKETRVVRLVDRARRTLVYLAYSTKVVEGSPFNSLSSVPVMPWQRP
jgi:CreA protein